MERKAVSAVFLTLIMLLSGCLGSDDTEGETIETEIQQDVVASFTLSNIGTQAVGDIVLVDGLVEIEPQILNISSSMILSHQVEFDRLRLLLAKQIRECA